ncbi:MAG: type IV toxin-antitoxin system AbiEi family antitoxin domain-containing protein [Fibrobacteraceae bacterium]|nr:type IV toxin-antitoxin system AbiEi family antitoxin domain-containing protein [Fibrobacteraceae bacterium]
MQETNFMKLQRILSENSGFITRKQVDEAGIPSWFLTDFVRRNSLQKIDKGFYADQDWMRDEFLVFQYKYPKFIFSCQSALFLHGLTDVLPELLEVTGPKNYRPFRPNNRVLIHTDSNDEIYQLGIVETETNLGNSVKVYDIEKMVCDFVKMSNRVDSEIFGKALRAYAKFKKKNTRMLMEYAQKMGIEQKMNYFMQVLLNED